jgi:Metal-dependent hydrolases of the beta-lactamase superfamily III
VRRSPVDAHLGLAALDDEETGAACALLRDGIPGREDAFPHGCRDLLELTCVEAREERHVLQCLDRGPGHGAVIHRNGSLNGATPISDTIRPVKLTVVGCSPAWPNPGGAQSGYLVEGAGRLLLDCGPGVLTRLRSREPWPQLDAIALTHFHLDHWGDIVSWVFGASFGGRGKDAKRPELWAPPGGRATLESFGERLGFAEQLDRAFVVREYADGIQFQAGGFAVTPCGSSTTTR